MVRLSVGLEEVAMASLALALALGLGGGRRAGGTVWGKVGESVGLTVGLTVRELTELLLASDVVVVLAAGDTVGETVAGGPAVRLAVGDLLGPAVGLMVGDVVGLAIRLVVGSMVGLAICLAAGAFGGLGVRLAAVNMARRLVGDAVDAYEAIGL